MRQSSRGREDRSAVDRLVGSAALSLRGATEEGRPSMEGEWVERHSDAHNPRTPGDVRTRPRSLWHARRSRKHWFPTSRWSSSSRSTEEPAARRTCGSTGSAPISRPCSPARMPTGSRSPSTALSWYRALEHPDFEGHGIREMVLLTVAAASASAALAASTASGQVLDTAGGGGGTSVTAVQPGDPGDDPVPEPGGRRRPEPVPGRSVDRRHAGRARNDPLPEPGNRRLR